MSLGTVAVIGAGPAGLAAIKSLTEEGFDVTGFESRSSAGGLWTFTDDPALTSVTGSTRVQLSKYMAPLSDFPMPDDFPMHPTAKHLSAYYQRYATHFGIDKKVLFNSRVTSMRRDVESPKWLLTVEIGGREEDQPRAFDKVLLATGSENVRKLPEIDGLDQFEGKFIHGQAFKRPQDFEGQRVMVIGQGNSAMDAAVDLTGHASKVYLSHRRGAFIIPRMVGEQRFDAFASWRATRLGFLVSLYAPWLHMWAFYHFFASVANKTWGRLDPAWRLDPNRDCAVNISGMIINDHLVPALRQGKIKSVHGVARVKGGKTVELDDGREVEVDVIVACTGYHTSFGPFGAAVTFSKPHQDVPPQPDLYRNIFPIDHADSLAVLNYIVAMDSAATMRELAGMAIAQVWAGKKSLPPRVEMRAQIDEQHTWFANKTLASPMTNFEGEMEPYSWLTWVDQMAGTGMFEHMGWTWKGIKFWLSEPRFCMLMGWGVNSPHLYRFFETGGRKAWAGARAAIMHVNELSDIDLGKKKKKDL